MNKSKLLILLVALTASYSFANQKVQTQLKNIEYERHEFRGDPVLMRAELSTFVYDIPYFGACGIFPPFHILNEIFGSGGTTGGMSPGATWDPFIISKEEYFELVARVEQLDPKTLEGKARYNWDRYEFDSKFDSIQKWEKWLFKVCDKHRDSYHQKMENRN